MVLQDEYYTYTHEVSLSRELKDTRRAPRRCD